MDLKNARERDIHQKAYIQGYNNGFMKGVVAMEKVIDIMHKELYFIEQR